MADVLIRPSELGDAAQLHANLRPADRAECDAYGHDDLAASLESNIRRSALCWTGLVDGELAAVIGVTPINLLAGVGSPWMLGTPVLDRHQRVLVRRTPDYIASMLQVFPHLVNFVHARNLTSVRWLARLGFTVYPPVPYGPRGELFHPFEMRARDV